ncbi:MAG: hypothetical protein QM533_04550 [Cytophagales bacterium]|nr:hypothetical protein [Cytophagales bacterium]
MTPHPPYNILILGASYGSLLGIKLLAAGHHVTMTCRTATAALIQSQGMRVRLPIKGRADIGVNGLLEVSSRKMSGQLQACTPQQVSDLGAFDLVVLAMQEPQYRQEGIRELMARIAAAGLPCMPIMNMPPLPYLARLKASHPQLDLTACRAAYADPTVWDAFNPAVMTLSSPDPQAFRPVDEPVNVLQVALPTNFKVARFDSPAHTQMLRQLEADIEAVRIPVGHEQIELPVKLKVFDSLFVPLAKWSMLLTGNYRCVQADAMRPIKEAILQDRAASQDVYEWVAKLCEALGAAPDDLVPFEKYAQAANGLAKPSSAARALAAGAVHIERVDLLVQTLAKQLGMQHASVEKTVALVDGWLAKNRATAHK